MIYTITNPEIIKAICPTGGSTLTVECGRTEKATGKISVDGKPALTVDHKWLKYFRAGLKRLTVREPDYSYKHPREAEKKLAAWKAGKIEAFREKVEIPAELWPGTETVETKKKREKKK